MSDPFHNILQRQLGCYKIKENKIKNENTLLGKIMFR